LIANVPLRPNSSTINPPPGGIPSQIRCDWFVICGRYVMSQDYTNSTRIIEGIGNITSLGADYKAGDYIELIEFGVARQSGDREIYGAPRQASNLNNVRYPRVGKWHAERIPIDNDPNHYAHKVTLDLVPDLCYGHFNLDCTVEIYPRRDGRNEKVQLACDDGSTWVLAENIKPAEGNPLKEAGRPLTLWSICSNEGGGEFPNRRLAGTY